MIDMIPMLDMVFLLLIFFAVTSTFEMQRVMELMMPEAASQDVMEPSRTLIVKIDNLNQLFLGNDKIDFKTYENRLNETIREGADLTLIIQGDEQAMHGVVVKMMDAAKAAGVKKIMVSVKKKAL